MSLLSRVQEWIDEDHEGLLVLAKDAALRPIRPFISRSARRAYLTTALLAATSGALLALAVVAYTLFYWSYIPRTSFERTIHLQFDHVFSHAVAPPRPAHPYPYGTAALAPDLVGAQAYDIAVELTLPRTRANREAGNFMLDVSLYAAAADVPFFTPSSPSSSSGISGSGGSGTLLSPDPAATPPLARSRRPAMLPYRSRPLDTLHRLAELPLYLLGLRAETAVLRVPMFEGVTFPRTSSLRNRGGGILASPVPRYLHLELQAGSSLHVYGARVYVRARFSGLRWMMYQHPIIAAAVGVAAFWVTEVVFAALAWAWLAAGAGAGAAKREKGGKREGEEADGTAKVEVKEEDEDGYAARTNRVKDEYDEDDGPVLSDTERTFPTLRGQPPLRYSSSGGREVKEENEEEGAVLVPDALARAADADDEDDEDEDVDFFDSGIGTSLDSAGPSRRDSMRRRRGRTGRKDEVA